MPESIRLASAGRLPARRSFAPQSDEPRHGAKSSASDRDLARLDRVNLLVVGADDVVAELLTPLWPTLARPVAVRFRGEPLRLPPESSPVATLLIYDVDTLTREEQDALHQWLSAGDSRARVVSATGKSVYPMVQSGAFNDGLYYHLNVVMIDLTSPVA